MQQEQTGNWEILRAKAELKKSCDKRFVQLAEALAKSYALKAQNDYYRSFTAKPN